MSTRTDDDFLASGVLGRALGSGFEPRIQQMQMAAAIAKALEERSVLMVEAGTGVGKSFAYLTPAVRRIIESHGEERVVIATNTIALQEQLLKKDVPMLLAAIGGSEEKPPFRVELVKGRGNYLSLRRLQMASERQEKLFLDEASRRSLHVIEDWAYGTTDGTLATLPPLERAGPWDRVQSDSGNCMGKKCPTYEKCFYQTARRRMERANLLICNHALFFSDLALRSEGVGFLPDYQHVILDEAHNVEEVASEHFGRTMAEGRVRHLLSSLWQPKKRKGYLASVRAGADAASLVDRAVTLSEAASDAADHFFEGLIRYAGGAVGTLRVRTGEIPTENLLTPVFRELTLCLKRLKDALLVEEDKYELNAYALRAASIADDAESLVQQHLPGCVYWVEVSASESYGIRASIACSPVELGPILKRTLFSMQCSVILTSATLTTGQASNHADPFAYSKAKLGCDEAASLQLGSPFDHARQAELHVDESMPDPRDADYTRQLAERIRTHIKATEGGAFVLFTSFRSMNDLAKLLRRELESMNMPVWVQGQDGSRGHILERFRQDERSVLFGTASFWQGVDVPGRALRNVIITRLPFDPPDRPLTQARLERIEEQGGNPFMEESLPRAVIRFKQGFGRLIRSAQDSGRVVVLDPRIVKSRYGKVFFDALPEGVRLIRHGLEE